MKTKDPHAEREAANYEQPIPSREFILRELKKNAGPATHEELCAALGLESELDIEALRRRLRAMQRDGQLLINRRGAYGIVDKMDLIRGRVQGHRDGFGFLIPDDGSGDLFINQRQMDKVLDGDRVIARKSEVRQRDKQEAVIVEVIERAHTHLVGRYHVDNGVGFVVPENSRIGQDVLIADDSRHLAKSGQIVNVVIDAYPTGRNSAVGSIVEVVGDHMAPGMEIDIALRAHGIPYEWSEDLQQSLGKIEKTLSAEQLESRVDMREQAFVTIDGEDARDFDDAVYCEPGTKGGWRLYVAIADVSHYVTVDAALDREALERGTSVYFPEQVIPMLPELLSNDLCSLNPHVDRPTMVCEMNIDTKGKVTSYCFFEGVIRSHARLTYTKVSAMLEQPESADGARLREEYAAVVPDLELLHDLYKTLHKARDLRGAIEFETTETRIIFGEERKIDRIVEVQRNEAHRLIEECMLCANVAAADFLEQNKLSGLFRVHDKPKLEKLANLREFLGEAGLSLGGGDTPSPKDYQRMVKQIGARPDAQLIQTVMLRSMQQAVYSPDNEGHFGLAYEAYAHFTSPIRRYPDLLVHRAIRSVIRSRRDTPMVRRTPTTRPLRRQAIYPYQSADMERLGEHCSHVERRADDAVRDVVGWLKCEFVQDRIGECFDGVITSVTAFGLFIQLKGIYVEGLLHVSALSSDYYHFDAVKHRLTGERTHFSYQLGDSVKVRVMRVNLEDRKIDFELPPEEAGSKPKRSKKSRPKRAKKGKAKKDAS